MDADYVVEQLVARGLTRVTGTPCSYLASLIDAIDRATATTYIPASSEGEAVAIASGEWFAGRIGVVLCQNSGLGNMVNPLTSLSMPFGIPVLLLISHRGKPGEADEPQHEVMGRISTGLLELMGIGWQVFPHQAAELPRVLDEAIASMRQRDRPYALIIEKTSLSQQLPSAVGAAAASAQACAASREEVLRVTLGDLHGDALVVATTGKTGRELYTIGDRALNIYCVGAMGYANALAHGIAHNTARQVVVLDGDGAAIMHLGNLVTIGARGCSNLLHVILDNGTYESTGGQPTASSSVDFASLAAAVGYRITFSCASIAEYRHALRAAAGRGPALIHMKIRSSSMPSLARPAQAPHTVARRLRGALPFPEIEHV